MYIFRLLISFLYSMFNCCSLKENIVKEMEIIKELTDVLQLSDASKEITKYINKLKSEFIFCTNLCTNEIWKLVSKIKDQTIIYQYNFIDTIRQSHGSISKDATDVNTTGFKSIQSWKENLTKICDEVYVLKANL